MDLLPESTVYAKGIAVCTSCGTLYRGALLEILERLMIFATTDGEVATARGVSFWIHRPPQKPRIALVAGWTDCRVPEASPPLSIENFRAVRRRLLAPDAPRNIP